jgi:hypothetical protein
VSRQERHADSGAEPGPGGWIYEICADARQVFDEDGLPSSALYVFMIQGSDPEGGLYRSREVFLDPGDAFEAMVLLGTHAPNNFRHWLRITSNVDLTPTATIH